MVSKASQLIQLEDSILQHILQYLDTSDIKNLSLTCCKLLVSIEDTPNTLPRLHVVRIESDPQNQNEGDIRMLPEVYPGSHTNDSIGPLGSHEPVTIPPLCSSSILPTYDEAQRVNWPSLHLASETFRNLELGPGVWLCPHRKLSLENLVRIAAQGPSPLPSIRDTMASICPFPKCSLWARHAVIRTIKPSEIYQLCSVIKIYRSHCPSYEDMRDKLRSESFHSRVCEAIEALSLNICQHNSTNAIDFSDFSLDYMRDMCLLDETDTTHLQHQSDLEEQLDYYECTACLLKKTYTTWGFIARYTRHDHHHQLWLDIEMALCRPLSGHASVVANRVNIASHTMCTYDDHWYYHEDRSSTSWALLSRWWRWASIVARDGFDWRAKLPPAFLKQPSNGLLDFPFPVPRPHPVVSESVREPPPKYTST